jgi:hypothetical protein
LIIFLLILSSRFFLNAHNLPIILTTLSVYFPQTYTLSPKKDSFINHFCQIITYSISSAAILPNRCWRFVVFSSVYFSFFIVLLSSNDFICVIAVLLSWIRRSFCVKPCRISNAFMLSILLNTTNCSNVA